MSKTARRLATMSLIAAMCLGACDGEQGDAPPTAEPPYTSPGAVEMAGRLLELARTADPRQNLFINRARLRALRQTLPPTNPRAALLNDALVSQELLRTGQTARAVEELLSLRARLAQPGMMPTPEFGETLDELLAVGYLRMGMEESCPDSAATGPCLISVPPTERRAATASARRAIDWYEAILETHPDDLRNRWLLNIAYMAAGLWPDSVPERWLVPEKASAEGPLLERFTDIASQLGVDVSGLAGGGIVEDFNRDGHVDILVSSRGLLDPLRYFQNDGAGGFVERSEAAGLRGLTGGLNLVHADYDNDGFPDVFVLRGAWHLRGYPNSLLRNNGDGTFDDVTRQAGVLSEQPTQTAAWADFDNDGWVDLFIGNETLPDSYHASELYRNNGDGTFTEVSEAIGLVVVGFVKAVMWGDYDNDGLSDLFISRYREPNTLFRNEGPDAEGRWRFRDVTAEAGVSEPLDSFQGWFWDFDNDGWEDIFLAGYFAETADLVAERFGLTSPFEPPRFFRNLGDGRFEDVAAAMDADRVMYTMGTNYGDLNNDGWPDFYVGTGDPDFRTLMPNRMFMNIGGQRFEEVTSAGGFGHLGKGHGISFADVDDDGDQDVHIVLGGAYEGDLSRNALYLNPGTPNGWLKLELEGVTTNRAAIGARIRVSVESDGSTRDIYHTVSAGGSFGGNPFRAEIGLGDAERILEVEITWPTSGRVDRYRDLFARRSYRLVEGAEEVVELPLAPVTLRP